MKGTIYRERSQDVTSVFRRAGRLEKVMIVPVDYAKKEHTAQFCLGTGDYLLRKPLTIFNSDQGLSYLRRRIDGLCKRHSIELCNVIVACEDPPSYLRNFIYHFRKTGIQIVRVNAAEASEYRKTSRASSDKLDLDGIAQCVINRKTNQIQEEDAIYSVLKTATHSRRKLVRLEGALKNQIHTLVDVLFPGFLNEDNTGITPFTKTSLWLMEKNFSSIKIKRMQDKTLLDGFRRFRLKEAEKALCKLKQAASTVLTPPPDVIRSNQRSLSAKIRLMQATREAIFAEELTSARLLIQTPGFYLLSFPGIGVVFACQLMAEYGDPDYWPEPGKMLSYSGAVPRTKQTGGSDSPAVALGLPIDCNHILKDVILSAAYHLGTTPHPVRKYFDHDGSHDMTIHHQNVENRCGRSKLSTAKMFMRIMRRVVREKRFYYYDRQWIKPDHVPDIDHLLFHECMLKEIRGKLTGFDISDIPLERNFLLWEEQQVANLKTFRMENNRHIRRK